MESRTIVVSLLIGIVVTVLSSLVPAVRSTRVPPIAALRAVHAAASRRRRLLLVVALAAARRSPGLAMILIGLFGSAGAGTAAGLIGGGAVAIVFAVSLFSPRLVPPLARDRRLAAGAAAPPARPPRARERPAQPEPHRRHRGGADDRPTVVTFVTVFAAGLKSSVAQVVDENFAGGLVIQNSDGFSPIPGGAAVAARKVPGVSAVATIRAEQAKLLAGGAGAGLGAQPRHRKDGRHRMEARRPGGAARPARRPGDPLRLLRLRSRPRSRRPLSPAQPDPPPAELRSRRRVRLQARRLRQRPDHPGGDGARVRPDPGHDRLRPGEAGRQPGRSPGDPHARASKPPSRSPKCSTSRN